MANDYFTPKNREYNSPTPGHITLLASGIQHSSQGISRDLCEELNLCGFNAATCAVTYADITNTLVNFSQKDLKLFLQQAHLTQSETLCQSLVNKYKNDPGLGGWNLKTQITYDEMAEGGDYKKFYNLIQSLDPSHEILISLVGAPQQSFMNSHSYKEYLEHFQEIFSPSCWLYVYYPITLKNGKVAVDYNQFFANLEAFSLLTRYTAAPFWVYARCQGFETNSVIVPKPTLGHLKFTIFSALAYGAQGIYYWVYRQMSDSSGEKYFGAPIDNNGNRTETWNYLQQINKEIRALDPIFCGSELIQCKHSGSTQYEGTQRFIDPVGPLEKISNGNNGVLISWLFNNNKNYLMIVNHDVELSQTVNLTFNKFWYVNEISIQNEKMVISSSDISSVQVSRTIEAGGYIIFTWR